MSWEDNIRKVIPYTPGEQPKVVDGLIKLNTNEFPYPPSPNVVKTLKEMDADEFRLYPAPDVAPLRDAIAKKYNVSSDEVFVGVGSDDVISMAFLTCFFSDKPILFPDITYSFYDVWAEVYKIPYKRIPLDSDFHIAKSDYMQENGGIIICNPNAPTGVSEMEDVDFIEDIVKANPNSVVIVDEAYVDFGGVSALPLIKKYENVLVVQTFSKSRAFAGMRIGYAFGCAKLIKYINDVKYSVNSYTMNRPSIACGVASISDEEYFNKTVQMVIDTREWTKTELKKRGFKFADSKTNFIFASPSKISAKELFEELKKKNIYVRWWGKERIDNYLRITIGTQQEMEVFINAVDEICG